MGGRVGTAMPAATRSEKSKEKRRIQESIATEISKVAGLCIAERICSPCARASLLFLRVTCRNPELSYDEITSFIPRSPHRRRHGSVPAHLCST